MKLNLLLILIISTLTLTIECVHVLTSDNFDQFIDGSKSALVEFYAPWCGHCKRLEPIYTQLGQLFVDSDQVLIGKVDVDAFPALGKRFGIQGYPTIKWFQKGSDLQKPEEYSAGRSIEDFTAFIDKKTGLKTTSSIAGNNGGDTEDRSHVVELDDLNFSSIALNNSANVLVEFYAPWCGHCKKLKPIYDQVAGAFVNEPSCIVANLDGDKYSQLGSQYAVQGYPTLKLFSINNKNNPISYDGSRTLDDLITFLNTHCGTHRLSNGKLDTTAGLLLDHLQDILTDFKNALGSSDPVSSLKKLKSGFEKQLGLVKKGKGTTVNDVYLDISVPYHLHILEKSIKSPTFVSKELKRLENILEKSKSIDSEKLDNLTIRKNILTAFSTKEPTDIRLEL